MHGTSVPDKVFHTCCALHNLLLDVDGLNEEWNNGVPSDYETTMLVDDDEIPGDVEDIPTALRRLANPVAARDNGIAAVDGGGATSPGSISNGRQQGTEMQKPPASADVVGEQQNTQDVAEYGNITKVRSLCLDDFRSRLVVHFDIAFKRNEVVWPQRTRQRKQHHSIQML